MPPNQPCGPESERESGFRLGHRPALDGLRGLAVLAVMAYHCAPRSFFRGGFLGVDLFFVLSGFLVTALLLRDHRRQGSFHLGRFYFRRMVRLLPALGVMLAACCLFATFRTRPERAQEIYHAALLTACGAADWPGPARPDMLGHSWSLSLEAQFYVVWPLLLLFLLRIGLRPRVVVWLIGAAVAAAGLLGALLWLGACPANAVNLAARASSLLAGCLVGLLASFDLLPSSPGRRAALQGLACAAAAVLLGLGATSEAGAATMALGGFTAASAAAAVVLAALVNAPPPAVTRALSAPALTWIGRISYGLYLWHFPLLSIAPKLAHGVFPAARGVPGLDGALAIGLAFGAAALSYYGVELPFLRWKDRFPPRPAVLRAPSGCFREPDAVICVRPARPEATA